MQRAGGQKDRVPGIANPLPACPAEVQPAADDDENLVYRMGVKGVHLARAIALQLDAALRRQQRHDGGIDSEFGLRSSDDLGHAACSVSSTGVVLVCASLWKGHSGASW